MNEMAEEICELTTLTDFCNQNQIDKIDLIKIDVEGFEYLVLHGFLETLANIIPENRPYFFIEVGWGTNHPKWNEASKIYQKLFEIGYKTVSFSDHTEDILFEPKK